MEIFRYAWLRQRTSTNANYFFHSYLKLNYSNYSIHATFEESNWSEQQGAKTTQNLNPIHTKQNGLDFIAPGVP